MKSLLSLLNFKGSASRYDFLQFVLLFCFFSIGTVIVFVYDFFDPRADLIAKTFIYVLGLIFTLGLISMIFKRSHDIGISGFWGLTILLLIMAVSKEISSDNKIGVESLFFVLLFFLGIIPTKKKNNRFDENYIDPNPKLTRNISILKYICFFVFFAICLDALFNGELRGAANGSYDFIITLFAGLLVIATSCSIIKYFYLGIFFNLIDFGNTFRNRRFSDEKIYEQVLSEIETNNFRKGLMAKALANSKGDEKKARALYIKLRYQSIKDGQ